MDSNDISNIVNSGNTVIDALQKIFPYWGLEGKALDVYINDIAKSDKPEEIKMFEILNAKKSIKRFKNAKSILELSASFTSKDKIENANYFENEEFYDQFLDKSSYISDKDAQVIWAKLLANEIEHPGNAPRGIFRILSEIEPATARVFNNLCEQKLIYIYLDDNNKVLTYNTEPIMFNTDSQYYKSRGLYLSVLNELEALGLISTSIGIYKNLPSNVTKILISDGITTECLKINKPNHLDFGILMFTRYGNYISGLIKAGYAEGQMEIMKQYYRKFKYSFDENNTMKVIIKNGIISVSDM